MFFRSFFRFALLVLPLLVAIAPRASAGTARVATTASARDFLAGEALGTAITAEGRLTLGAPLTPRAWPDEAADAVPFAAVTDSSGRVFVAAGGGIGRVLVSGTDGKVSVLWTAPDPNVTAIALAPGGGIVCATSPNGKIWRLDSSGTATEIGDPGEASVWALAFAPDGTLYAGTGNKGRVLRMRPGGKPELHVELEDTHIRSLSVTRDGRVLVGTSDRGLLVSISPDGTARTLNDSGRPEIVAVVEGTDGMLFAAATAGEPPSLGEPRGRPSPTSAAGPAPTPTPAPAPGGAPKPDETPRGTVSVSAGPARLVPSTGVRESGSGAQIVSIARDGFVEPAWTFPDETVYSMRWDAGRGGLVVTTGPRGRVYFWKDRHLTLEAQTDQKQAVSAPAVGAGLAVVTMNSPGIFRPASGARTGTYVSASRDAGRLSLFTRLRFEGTVPKGASVTFAVRAGNAEKPDTTWTPWTPLAGDVRKGAAAPLPAARYFQWKATLAAAAAGPAPFVERVELAYAERNARPVLENLAVLEPGAVFQRSGGGGSAVLAVTSPDENGIYAGLESARDEVAGPGKKLWRKGYRTITWKGADPNGDSLRYDLEARREGESVWFPVRKDLDETWLSFDTASVPDGRYRFRVTASDRFSNPEGEELTVQDETPLALVDNTPPVLDVRSKKVEGSDLVVTFIASDALSPITKAEAAVNADRWRQIVPADGASDSPSENYVFRTKKPDGACVVAVRVVDASGNASAAQVELP